MQYQLSRQLLLDEIAFSPNMSLCQETCYPNRSLLLFPRSKIRFSLINTILFDYEVGSNSTKSDTNVGSNDSISEKDALIQSLQEQIEIKDSQINELLQQQNQNQKLLVESKRTWLQRLFGLNVENVA